jgi:uncharacterized protein involved in exopolysaccharide biosynthesis
MTAPSEHDLDEQEIDVRRYGTLLAARWWLVAAGLVAGVVVGYGLALSGGSVWRAKALMTLGQPFSPNGGAPVASFLTSPSAVDEIIHSERSLKQAARAAGMRVGALRGHVGSAQVAQGSGAARNSAPLIAITVTGKRPARVEGAANKLASIVVERTTAPYVGDKIKSLKTSLASVQDQLNTLVPKITALEDVVAGSSLAGLDRVLVATQLDNAQTRRGQLLEQQTTEQLQLALAENVEAARVIVPAAAVKTTARSVRTSILVGGLIGLILGALAAILWEPVAARIAGR